MTREFPVTNTEARVIYDGLEEAEKGKLRLLADERLQDWIDYYDNESEHESAITMEVLAIIRFEDWKSLL